MMHEKIADRGHTPHVTHFSSAPVRYNCERGQTEDDAHNVHAPLATVVRLGPPFVR